MYKYFKNEEIENIDPSLIARLDVARELANTAFVITSGYRTEEKNKEVGGEIDSAHLTGKAGDIACVNSERRFRIVYGLLGAGFNRIKLYKTHIHVDISKSKVQDVLIL